jgi:iron complex outermembrane recepter protein
LLPVEGKPISLPSFLTSIQKVRTKQKITEYMKTLTFFAILLLFLTQNSLAQAPATVKISGVVSNAEKKPLDGAVISLHRDKDAFLVKALILDSANMYEFLNIQPGSFYITVSHIGYNKYKTASFTVKAEETDFRVPPIVLTIIDPKTLEGATVTAKVNFVERKIDRTVINPDALLSNAGTSALEVLEKSPGVQVDLNGNISLKGKPGVLVYIDDKPTYMAAQDLANYLRSLPSSSLGLIEIMTNPPAKYDAAGNVGIINIKLKKVKTVGLNGSVSTSYGQGTYARNNNSFNLSYRVNKVNFFSNLSYNANNNYQDLYIKRRYFETNGSLNSIFNQNSYIKRQGRGANAKLGLDYYINKKSTLGVVVSGFSNINKTTTTNKADLYDASAILQNTVDAVSPSKRTFKNGSVNLNYTYKFKNPGEELSFNADYIGYNSVTDQSLLSTTYLPDGSFVAKSNLVSELPATIDIKTIKGDYTYPLKKGGRFEAGAKFSFIKTDNIASFFDEVANILTINNDFSNNFRYDENISAAYINYNRDFKRISIQAGLRFEQTAIKGNQLGNAVRPDSSFTRDYSSFFPTFYLSYNFDSVGNNQMGFSYGKRIDRPNYQDMNPFTYPLDRFTLYAGNPFLQPTFSHNLELSHTYKNKITTTLSYSYAKDLIRETIEQSSNVFYSRPGNIGKLNAIGLSVNGNFTPAKWWTLQVYTEFSHNDFQSTLYGQTLRNKGSFWVLAPTNQFQINKKWNAELSGSYQSSVVVGQFVTIPVWTMRGTISKKILKNKGSLRMTLNDIFFTNKPGGDVKAIANSTASWRSFLDTRVLTVAFTYRFSKGKGLAARNSASADAEKNRVQ